jgi:cytoskeletal protein CcmA (bactofilin family)
MPREDSMFGKGSEAASGDRHAHSILQEGMVVRGNLEAKGDVRLDGRLEGNILVSERLTVGVSGVLHADVEAGEAIIMGAVEGTIRVHRRLELRKGARVVGDIAAPILTIEEGVHFHGNCNMRPGEAPTVELEFEAQTLKASDEPIEKSRFEKIYQ